MVDPSVSDAVAALVVADPFGNPLVLVDPSKGRYGDSCTGAQGLGPGMANPWRRLEVTCQHPATDSSPSRRPRIPNDPAFEALLIGGRSGVGKTTVGWEVSAQLRASRVAHCLIEGDNLDQAFPAPPDDPHRSAMTEANLAAIWGNYAALGYRRLVYTNTVSVLEPGLIGRAMAGAPRIVAVLLTADDETARRRLGTREIGSQLDAHVARSGSMARHLEATAPSSVVRVPTGGRAVTDVARDVIVATGWAARPPGAAVGDRWLEYP